MFLFEADSQLDCMGSLFEVGYAVNSGGDDSGQSPAHLAACGGDAFCLLWLLQTGADPNQQDVFGETPVHKAARAGSLECISVLTASDAQLEICNNEGKTAEDLAWFYNFAECGRFLSTLRETRHMKSGGSIPVAPTERSNLSCTLAGQKRGWVSADAQDGKKAKDW
ncbi:ankyrin repeat domain-containing protein 37 [Chanos chanos]|uniref:Ankyrin repeat domain-containing protein 37 n=1 Tax=Chanos chanos TaxID=29144 RepID=A0A6J2WFE8_CHACN|nr:ankyrin repeat domain-containing protein 37 [Chanos chanos]